MDQREIEGTEAPVRHDLDKAAVAHQIGLHHWREVADAPTCEIGNWFLAVFLNTILPLAVRLFHSRRAS
jgi:hypothetical protein